MSNIDVIARLREETSFSVMDIKKALDEAGSDEKKAKEILHEKGKMAMKKRENREAKNGVIEAYVHSGKIGVLVELNCETDFVAHNQDFKTFAHELALQISSMSPENMEALLKQPYIKDASKTIDDLLAELTQKIGENIKIRRFVRYSLGE